MGADRFETLMRALAASPSRRALLGIVGGGMVLPLLGLAEADAKKNRRRHKKNKRRRRKRKKKSPPGSDPTCDVCSSGCDFDSVQDAINAAATGATITVCAGSYDENLTIDVNLTLIGAGNEPSGTVLQGLGDNSVVSIGAGTTVTLESLLITGGDSNQGGGIYGVDGFTLTLSDCTVTENKATNGGGIFNDGGEIFLDNCDVNSNNASQQGGGIYNAGDELSLTGCEVSGNVADEGGGGIYAESGEVDLVDSLVNENTAHLRGGGIETASSVLLVLNTSMITQNRGDGAGGGIYNSGGTVDLNSSEINSNTAGQQGGGIFNGDGGAVTVDAASEIAQNAANPDEPETGGGIYNVEFNSTVNLESATIVHDNTPDNCAPEDSITNCSG